MVIPHDAEPSEDEPAPRRRGTRVVQALASLAVIVVLFGFAIPRLGGGGYPEIWAALRQLEPINVLVLGAVWLLGLWVYAFVLVLTLPGLSHTKAVVLNVAGSSVSNVVPFGGAVGVGATYAIALSWGFAASMVSAAILATGLFNFFATLALPVLALGLLVVEGRATWQLAIPAATGFSVIVVTVLLLGLIERSERATLRVGDVLERTATWVFARLRIRHRPRWKEALLEFRHRTSQIVRRQWLPLSAAVVGYKICQFVLLLLCVRTIDPGSSLTVIDVFAAFAFGRILSTVPVTPAGVGVVETGSIAALVALGGDQAASAAAVLLFSGFVYLLEIPLGGAAWIVWATKRDWRRTSARADEGAA
jgi:uncharacterized protein (TIRG00374 family)